MPVQKVLSVHLLRLTARAKARHFRRLQKDAMNSDPEALDALKRLGLGLADEIRVERTVHDRGKWRVVVP